MEEVKDTVSRYINPPDVDGMPSHPQRDTPGRASPCQSLCLPLRPVVRRCCPLCLIRRDRAEDDTDRILRHILP